MVQPFPNSTTLFTSKPSPTCTFFSLLIVCILGFYTLHSPQPALSSNSHSAFLFRQIFLSHATNATLSSYLHALTLHPHLAGTPPSLDTANFVGDHFLGLRLDTRSAHYNALLSYPLHSALSAHFSNGSRVDIPLTEPGLNNDLDGVVPPYHAYSPSGSAHAKLAFANHGTDEDYRALGELGVSVSGCVVIVRRGDDVSRGEVVRKAEQNGALAVLLYTERGDGDASGGFNKGFERGFVMNGVGDPLSPGWAGVDGAERLDLDDPEVLKKFPKIPSMPLSAEAAETLLGWLGGAPVPPAWRESLPALVGGVGPGPTVVNFTYQGEKRVVKIHNVFAVIRGSEEPDRYVLLGNHRDAWTFGAVDPNSGTAALLDIARRYSLLLRSGWNPRRTIILCSWDAEEFGMVGSTEWVEQNIANLGSKTVAYLNVDCAVQGPGFFVRATPQLDNLILEVTKMVKDPDSVGATVYEKWMAENRSIDIQRLSAVDSDFAPFLQHAGIPSTDMYYGIDFPVYHTAFDAYEWMTNFGDPLFQRHVAVAGIWGLVALHLADDSIIPFNFLSYADQLKHYKDVLSNLLDGGVSLHPLTTAIQEFAYAAKEAEDEAQKLREQENTSELVILKKRALNDRLMLAERGFLDSGGLQGRQWFKHLVYGPPGEHGSKLSFFPGVGDAMLRAKRTSRREGQAKIQHEIWRVARAIQRAANSLRGDVF
ncbi:probable glutamate carboxypeptidase AMP1 [Pyrus x bretschneideri]|uniref:probable glutamate carboxypeptidase AMP1 n=1 Tax=Pyrus x bretschneideri TaxID=225117 RepID=UPI002030D312|nr:probable glutamate carboxypeptidase AMP1 [Pyrus x bretschneideri]